MSTMISEAARPAVFRTAPCSECLGEGCEVCDGTGNWFNPKHYRAWAEEAEGAAVADRFAFIDPKSLLRLLHIAESVYPCGVQYPIRVGEEKTTTETETAYEVDGNVELEVEERDPKDLAMRYGEFFEQLLAYDNFTTDQAFELTRELLRAEQALPSWSLVGETLEIPSGQ